MSNNALLRIAGGLALALAGLGLLALELVFFSPGGSNLPALEYALAFSALPALFVAGGLIMVGRVFRDYHNDTT